MSDKPNLFVRIIRGIWWAINNTRKLLLNLIFFGILIAVIAASGSDNVIQPPKSAALVVNISGALVEQKQPTDPFDEIARDAYGQSKENETLVSDVIKAIEQAKNDDQIKMLVLSNGGMSWGSLAKMQEIGAAITDFKASEKPVYAVGGGYSQAQYYLASYADKIFMNHEGNVSLDGYSRYRMYHKGLLDKLKINSHIFRVGTYKSALEPYLRNDMSPAAKTANMAWLDDLWGAYIHDVARERAMTPEQVDMPIDQFLLALDEAQGDLAKAALNIGLVDVIDSDLNITKALVDVVGASKNKMSFNKITMGDYLTYRETMPTSYEPATERNIAVIVAKGTILNGNQPTGTIGGVSTSKLLKKARLDDKIKAVVLRIDSGGGSAYASEQIRTEVLALQAAGKPVVASLGSVAASGGYWIAASSDKIIAQPTTITGSIGIFGMINTFENTLAEVGVFTDGVATKELAGLSVTRDLPQGFKDMMQLHIEHGYRQFLSLVANSRNMTVEQVDQIAQGRVWSGQKAFEFGLVDQLGNYDDAVKAAAQLANLEKYSTKIIEKTLTPMEQFYRDVFNAAVDSMGIEPSQPTVISRLLGEVSTSLETFNRFDDPQNAYLYCMECTR
ncbi:MAG: signal peptide peptidase SppA [Psychrobium sp.]